MRWCRALVLSFYCALESCIGAEWLVLCICLWACPCSGIAQCVALCVLVGVSCLDAQLALLSVVRMVEYRSSSEDSFSSVFFGVSCWGCPVGFLFGGGMNGV